ncbi:MAG: transketolase, partial [Bacteriovoracaceae bacterium]
AALKESGSKLITLEDHQVIGGMGAQLIHSLKKEGFEFSCATLGVKGHFGQSAYQAEELYHKNGLDAEAVIAAFNQL